MQKPLIISVYVESWLYLPMRFPQPQNLQHNVKGLQVLAVNINLCMFHTKFLHVYELQP